MYRIVTGFILILASLGAHAALLSRASGQAYYDTVLDITWVADANLAQTSGYDVDGQMDWSAAQAWIASLNAQNAGLGYLGVNDWRLPTVTDTGPPGCDFAYSGTDCGYNVNLSTGEMAHMHYSTLGNAGAYNSSGAATGCSDFCLTNDGPFSNLRVDRPYWYGTTNAVDATQAWGFAFASGFQHTNLKSTSVYYAWAVRDGDIAGAASIDLTSGTTGSLLSNQSFNGETRSADVTLLGGNNKPVSSMTVAGVDIRDSSALVGARIYASSGMLIASANLNVAFGDNLTITVPIASTLIAGNSYRLAFAVTSSVSGNGNRGDLFDPNPPGPAGFGYVESQGLFQVNGGFQGSGDVFPTSVSSSTIPRISLALEADTDVDGIADVSDNCPDTANPGQEDGDIGGGDGRGNMCDNCREIANNSGASAQCDSNADGFGNRCDGDLSNNGTNVNAQDYAIFRSRLGTVNADADLNCNGGNVNAQDYAIFRTLLGSAPGPGAGP